MKQLFTVLVTVMLAVFFSTNVFAHSHLKGSNPADGDVVTEPLNEIVLEFDGHIEQGSFIDVTTKEGQAVEIQDIIIGDGTLTGTVAHALPNDEYRVNWSIISADGHPLEGEFSFTVNAEVPESAEGTEEPSESTNTSDKEESINSGQESVASEDEVEEESLSMTPILIVLLVVIVIGGFFLMKRKK